MLAAALITIAPVAQTLPAFEPNSVYGMKTFTTNPAFGFLPDKFVVGFAQDGAEKLTMHVLQGSTEVTGGGFYETETPYAGFRVLRYVPLPTVELPQAGAYVIEFRSDGKAVSRFPFEIKKLVSGDEFNSKTSWDFITPVDRMGNLTTSNEKDTNVWLNAWLAPAREQIPLRSMAEIKLTHGGKVVANALPYMFQEPQNTRRSFKLFKPGGRTSFSKSDLMALSGEVVGTITGSGKTLRTFRWTISGGKVKPFAQSESSYSPRTDYWLPRRLAAAAEGYQFYHLEECYWAKGS